MLGTRYGLTLQQSYVQLYTTRKNMEVSRFCKISGIIKGLWKLIEAIKQRLDSGGESRGVGQGEDRDSIGQHKWMFSDIKLISIICKERNVADCCLQIKLCLGSRLAFFFIYMYIETQRNCLDYKKISILSQTCVALKTMLYLPTTNSWHVTDHVRSAERCLWTADVCYLTSPLLERGRGEEKKSC